MVAMGMVAMGMVAMGGSIPVGTVACVCVSHMIHDWFGLLKITT
jgi:hypothetical protein